MIKYYCDCCEKETKKLYKFEYYDHLVTSGKWYGYVDSEINSTYGRTINVELCTKCYNKIVYKATQELANIKSKQKIKKRKLLNELVNLSGDLGVIKSKHDKNIGEFMIGGVLYQYLNASYKQYSSVVEGKLLILTFNTNYFKQLNKFFNEDAANYNYNVENQVIKIDDKMLYLNNIIITHLNKNDNIAEFYFELLSSEIYDKINGETKNDENCINTQCENYNSKKRNNCYVNWKHCPNYVNQLTITDKMISYIKSEIKELHLKINSKFHNMNNINLIDNLTKIEYDNTTREIKIILKENSNE